MGRDKDGEAKCVRMYVRRSPARLVHRGLAI